MLVYYLYVAFSITGGICVFYLFNCNYSLKKVKNMMVKKEEETQRVGEHEPGWA